MYNILNILRIINYSLKGWILWYVNYTSINLKKMKIQCTLFFELFKFVPLLKTAVKFSIGQGTRSLNSFIIGKQGECAVSAVPA